MPLEQVPCSSPRPNSQRAHNTVCSLENYVFGRRSIPRPNFASVRGGQPKTDLFRRYRSPARGLSGCARVSAQKPDVISRINHPRRDLARSIGVCPASPPTGESIDTEPAAATPGIRCKPTHPSLSARYYWLLLNGLAHI